MATQKLKTYSSNACQIHKIIRQGQSYSIAEARWWKRNADALRICEQCKFSLDKRIASGENNNTGSTPAT